MDTLPVYISSLNSHYLNSIIMQNPYIQLIHTRINFQNYSIQFILCFSTKGSVSKSI